MRCLVFGGGGFIGSHLCDALLAEGYCVRVFEKPGFLKNNLLHILDQIEIFEGNYSEPLDLEKAITGIDVIFHLISTTVPQSSNADPINDIASNLIPTLQILDISREKGIKKVVFFSSGGTVYGVPQNVPITEEHPTEPICSYGIHKLAVEKYLAMYYKLYGLDYTVLRVANPYGERQNPLGNQGAVGIFINKAINKETIEIWGDGEIVRDYIYIKDVAEAALKAVTVNSDIKVFNIGSGQGLSLNNIVQEIQKTLGSPVAVKYLEHRVFDVPVNVLDISRAKNVLGWEPATDFSAGLGETVRVCVNSGGEGNNEDRRGYHCNKKLY